MSLRDLARKSMTVQAALALVAVVLARVVVRVGRRWLGDDFLGADAASMIVTTLDGLVLVGVAAVAVGLRRALGVQSSPVAAPDPAKPGEPHHYAPAWEDLDAPKKRASKPRKVVPTRTPRKRRAARKEPTS